MENAQADATAEARVGDVYSNWRDPKMIYLITEIRIDRSPENGEGEEVISYQALYEGGVGGCRPKSNFFERVVRKAGEKRPTDPAYDGPRFVFVRHAEQSETLLVYAEKVLGMKTWEGWPDERQ